MTNPTASEQRSRNSAATAAAAQLLDSWAWLDGVSNTPSSLEGLDDFSADFILGGVDFSATATAQGLFVDLPLFPPAGIDYLNVPSPIDAFSPSQSQSQQSLLSLSPSSSTTLGAADSLQSFDMTGSFSQHEGNSGAAGTMSDAEFQMLLDGLSQEDMAAMSMTMPMSLPCQPATVDNYALHAFAPLDMFSPSMSMSMPMPMPVPVPSPLPAPEEPSASQRVRCRTCHRAFPTQCRLRKHEQTHTRPFACSVCHKGHAAKKDLHRHLWTTHPEVAEQEGIPCPMRVCPKCGFECRQDNLTRHMRKKHDGESV
ncbi:hypothetical protein SBRCBS47491_004090 [Sporothrix bragantina]|uniref:C2H2-type domain-containing protein n=1 Tax=Sporothrix bragantina TaxID=671064 RepID=A0ABP0BLW3_9PEZI